MIKEPLQHVVKVLSSSKNAVLTTQTELNKCFKMFDVW